MDFVWFISAGVLVSAAVVLALVLIITTPVYITAWVVIRIKQACDKRGFRIVNPQTPMAVRAGDLPADGQGHYRVQARIPQNGAEVELTLDAPTLAAARSAAEEKGLMATRVVKC